MTRFNWSASFVFFCLAAAAASPAAGQYLPPGGSGWGWYSPSTAGESYARGMADVVRSRGQYLLDSSVAAGNFEDARAKQIQNRYDWTKTYFDMRSANRAYRAAERGPRPTAEQMVRFAQAGSPRPLTASELDPLSGKVSWPVGLMTPDFAKYRGIIEPIFAEWTYTRGNLDPDDYARVFATTSQMLDLLRSKIRDMPTNTYIEAKNFIERLAFQVQQ